MMLTKRVIPCLDVAAGRVVRGVKFSADKDAGDPIEPFRLNFLPINLWECQSAAKRQEKSYSNEYLF